MEAQPSNELMIGGIKVKFPCKPYPSQFAMMSKIIKGLQNGSHCLLESPTGSGKTLALLCSALAWQEDIRNKIRSEEIDLASDDDCHTNRSTDSVNEFEYDDTKMDIGNCNQTRKKVPTVWFGTRTHKQIAQVTHELSRTAYKNLNMTILSSREQTCIHPINENSKNKNEGCRDLLKGKHTDLPGSRCSFYQNVHRLKTHSNLFSCGLTSAWDLEDFVKLGRRVRACPYFSSRELMTSAAIIFCPYNYLIDPSIRHQMNINLNNQIVILDEAHNIEDSSRDAASFTLNENELINTITDLDHLIAKEIQVEHHKPLHLLCTKVGQWMQIRADTLAETSYETWSQIWKGQEFLSCLSEWGITADTLPVLLKCFQEAMSTEEEEENEFPKVLNSASQAVLGGLFHALNYLFTNDKKYLQDYRVTIIRHAEYGIPPMKRTREGWISISKRSTRYYSVNLHFWCLNPAVAFSQLASAHSIILTSGTLAPMTSFSSELGLSFPIQLEAAHVIADHQVWVGTIGSGPNGQQLQATYQNTNALNFQDELGKLLLEVCSVVPYGVLCFFSSYKMLEKLCERWENTGLWNELNKRKVVFTEPHGRNKSNFHEVIQSYYEFTSVDNSSTTSGALLLAVCRGKISEGIDFSDNNARAVITVGIPFPNWKDQQVELKRKYNDEHSKSRGLRTGGEWYEIQAFRALNQALGRCIRHKNDWGALVIVDDRFCKNPRKYCKGLSKWVRGKVQSFSSFQSANDSLLSFCNARKLGLHPDSASCDNARQSCTGANEICLDQTTSNDVSLTFASETDSSMSFDKSYCRASVSSENEKQCKSFNAVKNKIESNRLSKENGFKSIQHGNLYQQTLENGFSRHAPSKQQLANLKIMKEDENCDDVIIIPSTPEKLDRTIVIPESPDSDDLDDFKCSVSKRKVEIIDSPKSLSHRLAKKCRQSLRFTEKVSSRKKSPLNESQEIFAPQTRKRRSLKATRREERKLISAENIVDGDDSVQVFADNNQIVACSNCQNDFKVLYSELKTVANAFHYTALTFSKNTTLYTLPFESSSACLLKCVSKSVDDISLDTAWCPVDMLAYQFYKCNCCHTIAAFAIVNSQQYKDFFLIPDKLTILS